jgi:hypothetical protein
LARFSKTQWIRCLAGLCVCISTATPVAAQPITVLAMIDQELAWLKTQKERAQRMRKAQKEGQSGGASEGSYLVSIVGVEPHLQATVRLNGKSILFQQGVVQPIEPAGVRIHLHQIKPPCVVLVSHKKRHTFCLPKEAR